ncbi:MAG: hypothetical protein ABJA82_00240 [Myxococcales bacterium]
MKVYFQFSVHEPLFHQVAKRLREDHGIRDLGGFAWGQDQADFLKGTGFPWWRLDVFTDWLAAMPGWRVDMGYLAAAEEKYGFPNFARMVFAERHLLKRYGHDDIWKLTEICLRRLEAIFDADRPDAIFVESIDSLPMLLLFGVARSRNIPVVHLDSGRIAGRVAVTRDPLMTWSDVDAVFRARLPLPLLGEPRAEAQRFLDDFRDKRQRIQAPRPWMFPTPRFDDLKRLWSARRRYLRDPLNPVLTSPMAMARQKVTRLTNHWRASLSAAFEAPVAGERYVLFPLHYQPEVSTLVMGTYYLDQAALIEDIAKSLPVGYRLYVKEHFVAIGRRPIEEYHRIRSCFNVRLIHPLQDPISMVQHASAVATISGTMGWEAVLMEKPTITFGDCFYNSYPQVIRAGLLPKGEWSRVFREALTNYQPDREMLLKYISSILDTTYEGYFSFDHPVIDPTRAMREENFRNIASVIATELRRFDRRVPTQGAA